MLFLRPMYYHCYIYIGVCLVSKQKPSLREAPLSSKAHKYFL